MLFQLYKVNPNTNNKTVQNVFGKIKQNIICMMRKTRQIMHNHYFNVEFGLRRQTVSVVEQINYIKMVYGLKCML